MNNTQLCDSLLIWLQTFHVDGARSTVVDVTDGVTMAQVLHQIAPVFFDDSWMARITVDTQNSWRLKVNNLKKVLTGILEFYREVLGNQTQSFHMPDVNAIAEHEDVVQLGRLLQLILGCAVNCDNKQQYIERIMAMEESVQHSVMMAIQELMTKETTEVAEISNSNEQLQKIQDELSNALELKDGLAQRCHELDQQVASLLEEQANILAENERLQRSVAESDNLQDESTPVGRRLQQLQSVIEEQQEEIDRLESAKDDLRIKIEVQEKQLSEVHEKNNELSGLAEEARSLKDEVDVLRHTTDKVTKYEATIESYKKKMDEMSNWKAQMKLVEDKNTAHVQANMELQEEVRRLQLLRTQLDSCKRQLQQSEIQVSEQTTRAERSEFEVKHLQERIHALDSDKQKLMMESDLLKETNEELRCMQMHQDFIRQDSYTDSLDGEVNKALTGTAANMIDMISAPPALKERIMRLEHENKTLHLQQSDGATEQCQLLQSRLDDSNAREIALQSQLRAANQLNVELEARLQNDADMPHCTENIDKLQKSLAEHSTRIVELEKALQDMTNVVHSKETEMASMEERYKRYLEKAKNVIRTLDPKMKVSDNFAPELQALRNQVEEKEKLIQCLKNDYDRSKQIREEEEKLIVTAWYNLGIQLNRKTSEERLSHSISSPSCDQSFLARQRQSHARTPIHQQNAALKTVISANR